LWYPPVKKKEGEQGSWKKKRGEGSSVLPWRHIGVGKGGATYYIGGLIVMSFPRGGRKKGESQLTSKEGGVAHIFFWTGGQEEDGASDHEKKKVWESSLLGATCSKKKGGGGLWLHCRGKGKKCRVTD